MGNVQDDVLDEAPCGFVSFDDAGIIKSINQTLLHILNRPRQIVEGSHISILLTVGSRIFYQTHLFPLLRMRGSAEEIYLSLVGDNGDDVPVLLNALRRRRDGDAINDCIIMPVRQRDRYEEEILGARKTAEEAVRDKDRVYAALAEAHLKLENVNGELASQAEDLQIQQEHLLEMNAELYKQAKREALLRRIGQSLRVQGNALSATILDEGVALLANALGADRCYFTEYAPGRKQVQITADWHRADLPSMPCHRPVLEFYRDIARLYRSDGSLVVTDSTTADAAVGGTVRVAAMAAVRALGMRSLVSVPLYADGMLTASLSVALADNARIWTEQDVELVQAVATLTRVAIDETRLREQSRRIAEQLQGALQPDLPKDVPGFKFSVYYQAALTEASVGGDFYDVFPLKAECYAIIVADLSGKGLKAAAQIAIVRHMLRTLLYDPRTTLSQALTTLGGLLIENELLEGFATVFVGVYDVESRALRYVNAGQEPGLLHRSDSGDILRLEPTGPVLGGFSGAVYGENEVLLYSGDVLALSTDGLTEAGIDRRNLLQLEGLEKILAESVQLPRSTVDDVADRIIAGVTSFATPAGIRDDVCLLVGRVL